VTRGQFLARAGLAAAATGISGALAACGGGSSGGGGGDGGGGGSASKGTVPYSNKSLDFFFFVVQQEAVKRAATRLGYSFETTNAKFDANQQSNDWQSLLLKQPKFLVSDPIDSEALIPLTKKAVSQNVPVGIIDTPLTGGEVAFTIAFDNLKGGELAAQKTVDLLKRKYGTPRGKVLNAYGALSSFAWRLRKQGFENVLKRYPDVQVISRPTNGLEETTRAVAGSTLSQFPDLDAAHAPSDTLTRGIVAALRAAGKLAPIGQKGHVILTSIDGEPQSLDWARQRILDAEVSQDPVAYGEVCVEMLNKYAVNGKPVPLQPYRNRKYYWEKAPVVASPSGPNCVIPPYYIDRSNVEDPRQWGNVVTQQWGLKQT
jgi:ABC-type sugar transport system substrate-binding protein